MSDAGQRSQGKARPFLPRAKDLQAVKTARDLSDGRDARGQAAAGNRLAVGAGQKHAAKKLLGKWGSDTDAGRVAADGLKLFYGALRDLPSDGALVRTLAGLYGRHAAVSAYFTAKAEGAGLDSEQGIAFGELASKHGQRAERLAVTALDIATRLAASRKPDDAPPPWMTVAAEEPKT